MSFIPQDKYHAAPLNMACSNNHLKVAQLLIINGADVDYQNSVCNNIIIVLIVFKMGFITEWAGTSSCSC